MTVTMLIVFTVLLWGVAPIIDKIALTNSDAWVAVIIRSWVIAIFATILMFIMGKTKAVFATDTKTVLLFSTSALMMGFLAMITFYLALKTQPASKIIPLTSIYPLVTALIAVAFLKESVSLERLLGVGLVVTGIWLVK